MSNGSGGHLCRLRTNTYGKNCARPKLEVLLLDALVCQGGVRLWRGAEAKPHPDIVKQFYVRHDRSLDE